MRKGRDRGQRRNRFDDDEYSGPDAYRERPNQSFQRTPRADATPVGPAIDAIVKAARTGKMAGTSRHLPPQSIKLERPSFRIVNSKPLTPSKGELDLNPRARSARLRTAIRTEEAPHALDFAQIEVPVPQR